ncbi:MAG: T9SS type A sorting domain-containing protein [Bacteroidota bacterium]
MKRNRFISCFVFLAFLPGLYAQLDISSLIPNSEELVICGDSAEISFVVRANGTPATGISLNVQMPEGINYVDGSLGLTATGSKQVSVGSWNNSALTLTAGDLTATDSLAFSFQFTADCNVISYFQDAITIRDTLRVSYNTSSTAEHITQALNPSIIYPQLSVLIPETPSGSLGEAISREIKIFNAKGCISTFDWYDIAQEDVRIDSLFLNGSKLSLIREGDTVFYTFSAADFQLIGNGDGEFCDTELSFSIVEYITLLGCGSKNSEIQVSWGCGGEVCQSYTANADVSIEADNPELAFTWRNNDLSECFHEQQNYKEVLIRNSGDGTATQIEIEIKKFYYGGQFDEYRYDGIDTSTVVMKVGDGNFEKYTAYNVELNYDHIACSENYVYRFTAAPPDLAPGDSAVLGFYVINCEPNEVPINSDIRQAAMGYNYRFQNSCQNNLTTGWNKVGIPYRQLTSSIVGTAPSGLLDEESGMLETTIQTATISYPGDGQFVIDYRLPDCGIEFSGNSSDMYWTNAAGSISWNPSSFSYSNDTITATFDISSQPSGFSFNGSYIRLKLSGSCGCPGPGNTQIVSHSIKYIPDISCSNPLLISMHEEDFTINVDLCTITPCDGPRLKEFSFDRVNFGLADDGFSRQPDYDDPINMDTIRLDRARYGDTLMADFVSVIDGVDTFSYGYAELTIDLPQYFTPIGGSIKVFKQSLGTYISCDSMIMNQASGGVFQFFFSPDTLAGFCPSFSGLRFEPGDSIFCSPTFRVSSEGTTPQTTVTISPAQLYVFRSALDSGVACGTSTFSDQIQLIKMEDQTATNYLLSNSCGETWARTYIRQYLNNDKTDVFFGEYRSWGYPDTIYVTPPDNFDFVNAYLLLRFNPIVKDSYLSPLDSSANPLVFHVGSLFENGTFLEPDDGYELQFSTIWQPSCNSPNDSAIEVPVKVVYNWDTPLDETYSEEANYTPFVRHKAPNLQLSNINSLIQDGLTNMVQWKVRIQNQSIDSDALNSWFGVEVPSGKVFIDSVYDETNSVMLSGNNGIFSLGTFGKGTYRDYTISASYSACDRDSLKVHVGWSCAEVPATIEAHPCPSGEYDLVLNPITAAANISIVNSPDTLANLCSPEQFDVSISSSLIANVNELSLDIYYPSGGLVAETGSFEIEYPSGSGYTSIADPDSIDGGYRLNFSDYSNLLSNDGLHGLWSSYDSMRTINLRFNLVSNCDFISGDILYMILNGQKPCGDAIDAYFIPTDPIILDGITPPYQAEVKTSLPEIEGCGTITQLKTSVAIEGGTTSNSESILIFFPEELNYDVNAYNDIHNGPDIGTLVAEDLGTLGTKLSLNMPTGVVSGDSIVFEIGVYTDSESGCVSNSEVVRTNIVFSTSVACGLRACTGFQAASGSNVASVSFSKPELSFADVTNKISIAGDSTKFTINGTVLNLGTDLMNDDETLLTVYADIDNNSLLDSDTDVLIAASKQSWNLKNGQSQNFTEEISVKNSPFDPNTTLLLSIANNIDTLGLSSQCFCDSISSFALFDILLPVEWVSFDAKFDNRAGLLKWSTAWESNSDYFSIQRSIDQRRFIEIGQLPAAGITDELSEYTFVDKKLHEVAVSTVYYRIQQLDLDGAHSMSKIQSIEIPDHPIPLTVFAFPSPADHTINIRCMGATQSTQLQLVSSLGHVMYKEKVEADFWQSAQVFDVSEWAAGIYFVRVSNGSSEAIYKFIVK